MFIVSKSSMCESACTHVNTETPRRSSVWPQHLVRERKLVVSHLRTIATVSIQLWPLTHSQPARRKHSAPWEAATNSTLHWPLWHYPCILLLSASPPHSLPIIPPFFPITFCCFFSLSYTFALLESKHLRCLPCAENEMKVKATYSTSRL